MHAQAILLAVFAVLQQAAAQSAEVCGDANLGGGCVSIPGDGACHNLNKADWASSYRTNGLSCTFYDNNNCFAAVIGPVRGEDGNLRNGEYNDQINSVKCTA